MLKAACLGCAGRSRGHIRAYEHVTKGELVAICDMDEQKLQERGDEFGVETRYTDLREMLEKEKPDVLHIVTVPSLRVELMSLAAEYEVPVAIVEKPIALQGEDWKQLRDLNEKCKTKFVVNTQLHFHPRNMELKRDVAEGRIGEVRFLDASARSTILDQGVHVLELAQSYNGFADPVRVFGNVSGARTFESRQPSPDMAEAAVDFANGARCQMLCGEVAPETNEGGGTCSHKRISAFGTRGFVQWTMHDWERCTPDGGYENGTHTYGVEDDLAQGALTDAAFDWVEDDSKVHPTGLDLALKKFNIILGAYVSALNNVPVDLPFDPPDGLLDALKGRLSAS